MRSLCTMNPVSSPTWPRAPATETVWACPPKHVSFSNNVTSWLRETTYAAVRPATPLPITATRIA